MEDAAKKDISGTAETTVSDLHEMITDALTDENAPLPHIGFHLMMVRTAMRLSLQKAATMMGMTKKQLFSYEVGTKAAKGEHMRSILEFINRFGPKVGYRGRQG